MTLQEIPWAEMGTEEAVAAAVRPQEYREGFSLAAYINSACYAVQALLRAAGRDPVAFREALDAYREYPGRQFDPLLSPEDYADVVADKRYGVSYNQFGWAITVVARMLEQPPVIHVTDGISIIAAYEDIT